MLIRFGPKVNFLPINEGGVFTYDCVCIERVSDGQSSDIKRIVVYNAKQSDWTPEFHVEGSTRMFMNNNYELTFRSGYPPFNHTYIKEPAYFITDSCISDFHQFWADAVVGLYTVLVRTHRLGHGNYILSKTPGNMTSSSCNDVTLYRNFFYNALVAGFKPMGIQKVPVNTCFRQGVFGLPVSNNRQREVVMYVLHYLGLRIIDRSKLRLHVLFLPATNSSRIININELEHQATKMGFTSVIIPNMETLPIEQQIENVQNADVMIGIQGAGLQWCIFMSEGATVVEVSWEGDPISGPYKSLAHSHGLKYRQIKANVQQADLTMHSVPADPTATVFLSKKVAEENVVKYINMTVNVNHLKSVLESIV
jgi:hypothetical protein